MWLCLSHPGALLSILELVDGCVFVHRKVDGQLLEYRTHGCARLPLCSLIQLYQRVERLIRLLISLRDDEWAIMRRHPEYARAMLEEIQYLEPALAVPCCHHER